MENNIGTIPFDDSHCVRLVSKNNTAIAEAYAYKVGFFRFNWHPSLEIMLVLNGKLKLYTENGCYVLNESDLVSIAPNTGHASILEKADTTAFVLHISLDFLNEITSGKSFTIECNYSASETKDADYDSLRALLSLFYLQMIGVQTPAQRVLATGYLHLITGMLLDSFAEPLNKKTRLLPGKRELKIQKITAYIDENFKAPISLQQLAQKMDMNRAYLSTYFKKYMEIGFHEYLTRKRLEYAAHIMNNSRKNTLDIALASGFPDIKSLNSAFKKYFNLTPGKYRSALKKQNYINVRNYYPVRLEKTNPQLLEKLRNYSQSFSLIHY